MRLANTFHPAETDNCLSRISTGEKMTVENIPRKKAAGPGVDQTYDH